MRKVRFVSTILIFILSFGLQATTYYVSKNGNDSNSGTSESMAWRTISKAAKTLKAGDEVIILKGTYKEQVIPENSGVAGKYITYKAKSGAKVIIDGTNLTINDGHSALFLIDGKNYIKVIGLAVENIGTTYNLSYDQAGFMIENSNNIQIKDCSTYNTFSSGIIALNSNQLVIDNNKIRKACNGGEQECISITDGSYDFEVMNNEVFDGGSGIKGGEGIDIKQGAHDGKVHHNYVHGLPKRLGIYVDSYEKHTYNIDIYQNTVRDCYDGGFALSAEAGGLLENINIYNNIAYHNMTFGIMISNWDMAITSSHPMKNIKIINNTFYNNKWSGEEWGGGIIIENKKPDGLIIRNNICSENLEQILVEGPVDLTKVKIDYNLVFGAQTDVLSNSNINGDPMFVNVSIADFSLQKSSTAINKGTDTNAPKTDFNGNKRPVNNKWDIGAFEYGSTLATDDFRTSQKKAIVYPNPFKNEAIIKISNNKAGNYTLKLYNSYGQVIKIVSDISKSTYKLQRGNLENGIYFFQILQHGKTFSEGRFIIN